MNAARRISRASGHRAAARGIAAISAMLVVLAMWPALASADDAAAPVSPAIRSQFAGDTAVRNSYRVIVSGTAPAGKIQTARLLALDAQGNPLQTPDGRPAQQLVPEELRNQPGVEGVNDFLTNDNGQLRGQLPVGCMFSAPPNPCPVDGVVRKIALEVTIAGIEPGVSAPLRVDYDRPRIEGYELVATDRVRVEFTEPVRHPQAGLELMTDWSVAGAKVVRVDGPTPGDCSYAPDQDASAGASGCTRTLVLDRKLDEDATPLVDYTNTEDLVPTRSGYQDFGSNRIFSIGVAKLPAVDRVRPAAPTIRTVGGQAPVNGRIIWTNQSPVVRLTNLVENHTVTVTASSAASTTSQAVTVPDDSGRNGDASVDVPLTLSEDGKYLVNATAEDIHGNRSDEPAKSGPRADGASSVSYTLDTTVPQIINAHRASIDTVEVLFSEALTPAGNAGQWSVGEAAADASGRGEVRTLTVEHGTPDGNVRWIAGTEDDVYIDQAGNPLRDVESLALNELQAVAKPTVTSLSTGRYTRADSVTITGSASGTFEEGQLVAELFEKGSENRIGSPQPVSTSGSWTLTHDMNSDGRYELQVRLRDVVSGVRSARTSIPAVVRDTAPPAVDVVAPAAAALPGLAGEPAEYKPGETIDIKWTASDAAPNDPVRPDHGRSASVFMVAGGSTRLIKSGLAYAPGVEQSLRYTFTNDDLGGKGLRDLQFKVVVDDLAANKGSDLSGTVRLLDAPIGYTAVLTARRTIEVRFAKALKGAMFPTDWKVDAGVVVAEQPQLRDGRTVVKLHAPMVSDPNATPKVQFSPVGARDQRLRTDNDTQVSLAKHTVLDRVKPALTVTPPDTAAVVDRNAVTFTGTTDQTASPNTIRAYRADAAGYPVGSALTSVKAETDGTWTLDAPLTQNARNRIVIRATDPSANSSATLPTDPYTVVEDSKAPVLSGLRPARGTIVGPEVRVRWTTTELHKKSAAVRYRPDGGSWTTVAAATADDGSYRWSVPRTLHGKTFALRVVASDRTGKTGRITSRNLRLDAVAPRLRRARTVAPDKVRVSFSEPVFGLRAGAFEVDGMSVRRIKGTGSRRTLVLDRPMSRTTPTVAYNGRRATDQVGNVMARTQVLAERGFAFPVSDFEADRLSRSRARLTWTDLRNRATHIRGYRIYRDGDRIATLGWSARSFTDTNASGPSTYKIRVLDSHGRLSIARTERLR